MNMKRALVAIILLLSSVEALAHLRWFVKEQGHFESVVYQFDGIIMASLIGATMFILLSMKLNAYANSNQRLFNIMHKPYPALGYEWLLLRFLLIIPFVANLYEGVFLAPNLLINSQVYTIPWFIQLLLVFALFFSHLLSGIMICLLVITMLIQVSLAISIDYLFEFLGIGLALILVSRKYNKLDEKFLQKFEYKFCFGDLQAAFVLRITVGLQLIVLGVHNKLLDPGMGLVFMEQNQIYNFMQTIGLSSFSNLHFVFAAGVAETVFGLLLVFGIATRFVMGVLAVIFTTTLILTGIDELLGHLPIFGIAFIVLLYGKNDLSMRSFICHYKK